MSMFGEPLVAELRAEIGDFVGKMGEAKSAYAGAVGDMEAQANAKSKAISDGLQKAGVTAVGVAGVIQVHADKDKTALNALKQAIENNGQSYATYASKIEKVEAAGRKKAFSDSEQSGALAKLTMGLGDTGKALDMMTLAEDIARTKGIGLGQSADMLVKIFAGSTKAAKSFGIDLDELAKSLGKTKDQLTAEDLAAAIGAKTHGQAAAAVDTLSGKFKVAGVEVGHYIAKLDFLSGPLATVGTIAGGVGKAMEFLRDRKLAAGAAAAVMAGAETTEAAASTASIAPTLGSGAAAGTASVGFFAFAASVWAAMLPFLPIIALLAALGLAAYLLWDNWDAVWGFIKDLTKTVVDFVKEHLDIFLVAVTGPIAPILLLWRHWDEVWSGIKRVLGEAWEFVKGIFNSFIEGIKQVIEWIDKLVSKIPGGGLVGDILGGLPGFAVGGTVPGPIGSPQLAIVHGGETINRPGGNPEMGGGGGVTVVVNVHGSVLAQRDIDSAVQDGLGRLSRRGASVPVRA